MTNQWLGAAVLLIVGFCVGFYVRVSWPKRSARRTSTNPDKGLSLDSGSQNPRITQLELSHQELEAKNRELRNTLRNRARSDGDASRLASELSSVIVPPAWVDEEAVLCKAQDDADFLETFHKWACEAAITWESVDALSTTSRRNLKSHVGRPPVHRPRFKWVKPRPCSLK